ncbi:hypothetical protein P7D22_16435 [Lichenihabitans sp. Uapishka_5]|uniref:general stress protein n=1 Tax=Lichenihabitans sp. Uapishka_5 TaxID=3037302 RepID=UPI0029E7FE6F|nr:general stress protein [Lichenihabitans sp. Uapishka_5]MDX7952757.1 hypothetical protein [Lichenihabitans sp. Uapishka_5]
MTQQTYTALFDTYASASTAVTRLEGAGVPHDYISIVSNDESHREHTADHAGTGTGASLGTLLGGGAGLLAGLGLLAIPGLGPVVAAGWLASTLVGAGVGAAAGGIVGGLTDAGISHDDAHAYAEGIQRGGTLVTVKADNSQAATITNILDEEGTVDLDARTRDWRETGWSGSYASDPAVAPDGSVVPGTLAAPVAPVGGVAPRADDPNRSRVRVYDSTI